MHFLTLLKISVKTTAAGFFLYFFKQKLCQRDTLHNTQKYQTVSSAFSSDISFLIYFKKTLYKYYFDIDRKINFFPFEFSLKPQAIFSIKV